MHYVRFAGDIHEENGDWEQIVRYEDGGGAVGIVTELRPDLEEITEATYLSEREAIIAHNAALPAPPEPVPSASPIDVIKEALIADPGLAPETKDAIRSISGGAEIAADAPMAAKR